MELGFHWYGFWILVGVVVWVALLLRDVRMRSIISRDHLFSCVNFSIIAGILGGRLMHVAVNFHLYDSWVERLAFWDGGMAILGAVFGILGALFLCVRYYALAVLPFLDIVLFYAPLAQAFGRLGCIAAGCCYGCESASCFAVYVCTPDGCFWAHPIPAYTIVLSLLLFAALIGIRFYGLRSGVLAWVSLTGLFSIRFITDFWRGDRELSSLGAWLSIHQWVSIFLLSVISCFFALHVLKRNSFLRHN